MKRETAVLSVVMGLGLAGVSVISASGQTRVVVPIIVRQPSLGAAPARTSVQVTTRTSSPQSGVTQTQVTVRDTTGIRGYSGSVPTGLPPGATQVTVRDTTGIRGYSGSVPSGLPPGTTQVTVRDTTGIRGYSGSVPAGLPPGTTQVTVRDTTGVRGFAPPGSRVGVNPGSGPSAPRADGPAVIVPFPVTRQAAAGGDLQSVIITSEGPIDFPIIILAD